MTAPPSPDRPPSLTAVGLESEALGNMRGLRVYVNTPSDSAPGGRRTFYSRRADGPLYRWLYEEEAGRWRGSRVLLSVLTFRLLCVANWKALPVKLQEELYEHYLE